ncbi:hypothetical protein ACOKFD_01050 [Flagellimonas sp. S174]|uniref:hypothetical protein n=1 Tax=Flagellimonas sp. S174 TaxID=3410790 RepID=UPI003BF4DEB3
MKVYESLHEIEEDLKIYDLERKIAKEEAKNMGFAVQNGFIPNSITKSILRMAGRYGLMILVKKILR